MRRRNVLGATLALTSMYGCTVGVIPNEREPDRGLPASVPTEAGKGEAAKPVPAPTGSNGGARSEIDATVYPWKPPTIAPGSCTTSDLDGLVTFARANRDPATWWLGSWTTNETCRSCVFAVETATWSPFVLDVAGHIDFQNVGGCIALASGVDACGKSYQQWWSCLLDACSYATTDGSDLARAQCITAASKTTCKTAFAAIPTACGGVEVAAAAETACDGDTFTFEGPIRLQCIGLPDGGP